MLFAMVCQTTPSCAAQGRTPNILQACNTVFLVTINIITYTSSNLIDPNDHTELSPENIEERVFGSKMVLVTEQMQIMTIWAVKVCLLIMYNRLTYVDIYKQTCVGAWLTILQYESEAEPSRQDRGWLRCLQLHPHGDSLSWRLVQTLLPILGSSPRQWSVYQHLAKQFHLTWFQSNARLQRIT
jgi:hypothetical protein